MDALDVKNIAIQCFILLGGILYLSDILWQIT